MPEINEMEAQKVLVAEDEECVLAIVSSVLARAGYDVLCARDGRYAQQLFNRHARELALLIVDIAMPKVSGTEFISKLPTLAPRIPVLFITGLGEHEVEQKVRGDFPVLFKPFSPRELLKSVDALTAASGAMT